MNFWQLLTSQKDSFTCNFVTAINPLDLRVTQGSQSHRSMSSCEYASFFILDEGSAHLYLYIIYTALSMQRTMTGRRHAST